MARPKKIVESTETVEVPIVEAPVKVTRRKPKVQTETIEIAPEVQIKVEKKPRKPKLEVTSVIENKPEAPILPSKEEIELSIDKVIESLKVSKKETFFEKHKKIIIDASIAVLVCALAYTAGHLINKQHNMQEVNTSVVKSETN